MALEKIQIDHPASAKRFARNHVILWTVLFVGQMFFSAKAWVPVIYGIVGIMYLGLLWRTTNKPLVVVENNLLIYNTFPSRKMELNGDVEWKKFAGDYVIQSRDKSLSIPVDSIPEQIRDHFEELLNSYRQ